MLNDKVHLPFTGFGCADYLKLSYEAINLSVSNFTLVTLQNTIAPMLTLTIDL